MSPVDKLIVSDDLLTFSSCVTFKIVCKKSCFISLIPNSSNTLFVELETESKINMSLSGSTVKMSNKKLGYLNQVRYKDFIAIHPHPSAVKTPVVWLNKSVEW